ncbi:MAG: HesA/MoeB/ThiF family protein [Pseudomonadota bacterium]
MNEEPTCTACRPNEADREGDDGLRHETDGTSLSDAQCLRYARQILLPEVGEEGQARLLKARVLVVGAGGLGVPIASYLAAAGIGTLGIADSDRVDIRNLHRQIAYMEGDVGAVKVDRLGARIHANNSEIEVLTFPHLTRENADAVVEGFDIVVDGCDNYPTRYLVNEACVRQGKILVSGALSHSDGQLAVFVPGEACYHCMVPQAPDSFLAQGCVEGGILGPFAGLFGCWQALETVRQLLGSPHRMRNELLLFDARRYETTRIRLKRRTGCPTCGG